ncbi:tetratricopeptide repeat protein [Candidatus Poribacteria bacterium]|nr:tetratricopeptide repeat protein [Candidatus Poribacteria bacterium]
MGTVTQTKRGNILSGALPFLFLAGLTLIVYAGTLRSRFIYDDHTQLVENVALRSLRNIPLFFLKPEQTSGSMIFREIYRPLRSIFFAVEYQIWGHNPVGYHAVNIIIHAINAGLVFIFLSSIMGAKAPAFASSLLFVSHPALTENVCWVCSRSDLLCMLFYLTAILCYLRSHQEMGFKKTILIIASLAATILSLFSKEMGVTLVGAIIVIDLWHDGFSRQWVRRWQGYIPFAVVTLVYLVFRSTIMSQFAQRQPWGATPLATAGIMAKGIAYYIRLLLFPFKLTVFPFVDATHVSVRNPETLFAAMLVIGLLAGAFVGRRRYPYATLGIVLFFVLLLPVSNIVPIKAIVGDRFIYIPSLGFFVVAGAFFNILVSSQPAFLRRRSALAAGAIGLLVLLFSVKTIARSIDWRDDFALFSSAARVAPDSPRARIALAKEYFLREDYDAALEHGAAGIRANPYSSEGHILLGSVYFKRGLLKPAEEEFKIALTLDPLSGDANNSLGIIYREQGRLDEALTAFQAALKEHPVVSEILNNVGSVLLQKGEVVLSLEYFARALDAKSDNREAAYNTALALLRLERFADAVRFIESRLPTQPNDGDILILLGQAYAGLGDYDRTVEAYLRALALNPADVSAITRLANLHAEHGAYEKAIPLYRNILARYPASVAHRVSLASALEKTGRQSEAIEQLEIAIRFDPENAPARSELARILKKAGRHREPE